MSRKHPAKKSSAPKSVAETGRRRRNFIAGAMGLLLFGGIAAFSLAQWTAPGGIDASAATSGPKVPQITLETSDGQYVIGQTPGRVEVLFFSFPG